MNPTSRLLNRVPVTQNEPVQLQRLKAQRQLYGQAKRVLAVQMMLGGPATILIVCMAWCWPELRFVAATFGIIVLLLDTFVLTAWQSRMRETAAKIQEAFDCDVLELPWPKQKAGKRIDPEIEVGHSVKYMKVAARHHPVTDWYPVDVARLPMTLARAICQRANCWWDSSQRRLYVKSVSIVLVAVVTTISAIAVWANWSSHEFMLIAGLPLLPFLRLAFIQIREHRDAAVRLDKLKEDARELFDAACADPNSVDLNSRARALQDEIFESRKRNPPLFDWIFHRLRPKFEVEMNFSAAQLIDEASRR